MATYTFQDRKPTNDIYSISTGYITVSNRMGAWVGSFSFTYEYQLLTSTYAALHIHVDINTQTGYSNVENSYFSLTVFGETITEIDRLPWVKDFYLNIPWENILLYHSQGARGLSDLSVTFGWQGYSTETDVITMAVLCPQRLTVTYPTVLSVATEYSFSLSMLGDNRSNQKIEIKIFVNGQLVQTLFNSDNTGTFTWTPTMALYASLYPTQYLNCPIDIYVKWNGYNNFFSSGAEAQEVTFSTTLSLDSTLLLPSVNATISEGSTLPTAFRGLFVSGVSKYKVKPSITTKYGATIQSISINAVGGIYDGNNNTDTLTDIIRTTSDNSVIISVVDSRGLSSSRTFSFTVIEWFSPMVTAISIHRGRYSGGVWTPDDTGNYCKIEWAVKFAPVNNLNSKYLKITAPDGDHVITLSSYVQSGVLYSAADTESSYDIVLTLTDYVTTFVRTVTLSTAGVVLDIKAGGKGVGFGKVAEYDNCIDFNPQWDVRVYGMTLADYIRSIVQDMN